MEKIPLAVMEDDSASLEHEEGEADCESVAEANDVFASIRKKLKEALEPILDVISSDRGHVIVEGYKAASENYASFVKLSEEAGSYFRELIPSGAKETDFAYSKHAHNLSEDTRRDERFINIQLDDNDNNIRSAGERGRENKKELKRSVISGPRKPFEGEVSETKDRNGIEVQECARGVMQSGEQNIVYERISNSIDDASNYAWSELVIQDTKTGFALDLVALLPQGWTFTPSFLAQKRRIVDLKDYEGPKTVAKVYDRFSAYYDRGYVAYGDIARKGGMLTLFHEIAHAWQGEYFDKESKGKRAFKELYEAAVTSLDALDLPPEQNGDGSVVYSRNRLAIMNHLGLIGIEIYKNEGSPVISSPVPILDDGVINILSKKERTKKKSGQEVSSAVDTYHPIRSEKLQEAMDSFIAEERDAWAHALRTMRFLRSKGLDVEPQLKTLTDVKELIDRCLGTYQNSIESMIDAQEGGYRFSRLVN